MHGGVSATVTGVDKVTKGWVTAGDLPQTCVDNSLSVSQPSPNSLQIFSRSASPIPVLFCSARTQLDTILFNIIVKDAILSPFVVSTKALSPNRRSHSGRNLWNASINASLARILEGFVEPLTMSVNSASLFARTVRRTTPYFLQRNNVPPDGVALLDRFPIIGGRWHNSGDRQRIMVT
jgi:hypothetical protein